MSFVDIVLLVLLAFNIFALVTGWRRERRVRADISARLDETERADISARLDETERRWAYPIPLKQRTADGDQQAN